MTDHFEERTGALESDIRRTRDRMGEDIEAIGEKLSPARIKERAKDALRRKTREAGAGLIRSARENPVPAAMVAVGLTWLMRARNSNTNVYNGGTWQDDNAPGTVKEKVQEKVHQLANAAGDKVEHVKERVSQKAKRTSYTLQSFFEENPLIGAAGVLVLGAAVGAVLPHTEKEDRLMGSARDELVEQAQGVVEQARETFEEKLGQRTTLNPFPGDRDGQQ